MQIEVPFNLDPIDLYKTSRGPADAHQAVANYLQAVLPAYIDKARIDWERTEYQLPYPVRYGAYNSKQIEAQPAIMTIITKDSQWNRTDLDRQMGLEFNAEWDVKLYIWIGSPEDEFGWVEPVYENTLILRDDLATLVRAALLTNPSLGLPERYKVQESDLSTEYLEIKPAGDKRPDYKTVASISFTLQSRETVAGNPFGVVEFTTVEADVLPLPVTTTGYVP